MGNQQMLASDSEMTETGNVQPFGRRCLLYDVFAPFAASRVALIVIAWLGLHLLQIPLKDAKWEVEADGNVHRVAGHLSPNAHPFVNMWARWDSGWYLDIAQHGYSFVPGKQSNVAFLPLYPDLIRLVHFVFPLSRDVGWLDDGIILSNLALLVALIYLYRLVRLDYERRTAARAVLYVCVFPTTLFLSAVYSESLFLALVVAAFYYARTARWFVAGLLAAAAAVCRPPGILLVLPLVFEYMSQRQFQWRRIKPDSLALSFPLLALVGHLVFLRLRFGEWDVIERAQLNQGWKRTFTLPWNTVFGSFHDIGSLRGFHGSFEVLFTIALFGLAIFSCFRLPRSYAIYAVVSVLFITSWGTLLSTPRFGLVIFPIVMVLALLGENKLFHRSFLAVSMLLAAISMVVFSEWGWVA